MDCSPSSHMSGGNSEVEKEDKGRSRVMAVWKAVIAGLSVWSFAHLM